jgi:hypothetical protein
VYTLDFAGRKIKDDKQDISFQSYAKDVENILSEKTDTYVIKPLDDLINEDIDIKPKVVYDLIIQNLNFNLNGFNFLVYRRQT